MTDTRPSNFCIAPFVNFSVTTDGRVRLCCQAKSFKRVHVHDDDIEKIWKSDEYVVARNAFLDGRWPDECQVCMDNTAKGIPSRRELENSRWSHLDWEALKSDPRIYCYDLRMGNTCNLKCVMCHPLNSSMWVNEMDDHPHMRDMRPNDGHKWAMEEYLLDQVRGNLLHAQMLYFSGGEPLLIKKHQELIDHCIANGHAEHIELVYDTNGTMIDEGWIERWGRFKSVQINLSIDGGREVTEYVRYPVKYDSLLRAMDLLRDSRCDVYLQLSLAAYNIFEVDAIVSLRRQYGFRGVNISTVYWPSFMGAQNLPDDIKRRAKDLYRGCPVEKVRKYVDTLECDGSGIDELKAYFARLDLARNLDYRKVFPWMG